MWEIVLTKQAVKDLKKADAAGLGGKIDSLIEILASNPYQNPPPYEKLVGDLSGYYSRRINIQHRLVDQVFEQQKKVKVIRLWSHYE
jgi:Txe/YoeB family toxin of toxin-antitoxin system